MVGEGNGNALQYSAWRIPWTEEPIYISVSVSIYLSIKKEREGKQESKRQREEKEEY